MPKPLAVFPYTSTVVGGSYVSSSLLTEYLASSPAWGLRVCLPQRGRNALLFESRGVEPDYLGIQELTTVESMHRGFRQRLPKFAQTFRSALNYLHKHKPKLVHINDHATLEVWGLAAKLLKIPVLHHVRQEQRQNFDKYYVWLSDYLIFVADANRVRFEDYKHLPPHSTIYNPVDFDIFYPRQDRQRVKVELGLQPSRLTIGFVGNLTDRKRPEWAVRAAIDLLERGLDIQLVLVGQDYSKDGEYQRRLASMAESVGASEHIHLLGYREDVADIMRTMDILLLPSVRHGEAFPRAVIEAMASGVAVVATNVAGVPEAFTHGVSGLVADPDDYCSFFETVHSLARNEALQLALGRQAYQEARARYSVESCGRQVLTAYDEIMGRSEVHSRSSQPQWWL